MAYLFLVRPMKARLVVSLLIGLAGVVHASNSPVQTTLDDTPDQEQSQQPAFHRWIFKRSPAIHDSDSQGAQWQFKFIAGSDKPLGTAADSAAIKALLPSNPPATVRWLSRSMVVVVADHRLFVLEKQRSKWKMTHYYFRRGLPTV